MDKPDTSEDFSDIAPPASAKTLRSRPAPGPVLRGTTFDRYIQQPEFAHCYDTKGDGPLGEMPTGEWRRSSACANSTCVEVTATETSVLVRHARSPDGVVLRYTREEWRDFLIGAKAGEFDDLASPAVPGALLAP